MTYRLVPTPLDGQGAELEWPEARPGGMADGMLDACIRTDGIREALDSLAQPEVLVVTSGQQPGLFTGPLYTLYKAISARALAQHLRERWDRPVVPVFWTAGDDHDFAEANHANWLRADGSLATASLEARPETAPLTPLYRLPLGTGVLALLDTLEADLASAPHGADVVAWLGRHYRPDATIAGAFNGAMAELLAPLGVVCFDSTHPAAKRLAARHIMKAVGLSQDLDRDLAARARALEQAGVKPGVSVGDGATLAMLESRLGRDRLIIDGRSLVTRRSQERFQLDDLHAIAAQEPSRLSANVLLRPVIESALLPTVAYVAGPGELRYLELTPPIYQRMRIIQQRPMPRWSGLIVPRRVDRVLEKFEATLDELLRPGEALETRVVRSHVPTDALSALASLREAIEGAYDTVERLGVAIDPTLEKPLKRVRHQALAGTADAEHRLISHLKRREKTELRQIARARTAVRPLEKPQERVLGLATFRALYGDDLIQDLARAVDAWYSAALEGNPIPS